MNTSNSTKTPHGDILREQTGATETLNSTYLQKVDKIENTPFDLIQTEEEYFAALGQFAITPKFKTAEEVLHFIDENMWHIVLSCIAAFDIGKNLIKVGNK